MIELTYFVIHGFQRTFLGKGFYRYLNGCREVQFCVEGSQSEYTDMLQKIPNNCLKSSTRRAWRLTADRDMYSPSVLTFGAGVQLSLHLVSIIWVQNAAALVYYRIIRPNGKNSLFGWVTTRLLLALPTLSQHTEWIWCSSNKNYWGKQ